MEAQAANEQELTPDGSTPQRIQVYTGSKGGRGRSLSHNAPNLQCTSRDSNSRSLSPDTALLLPAPRGVLVTGDEHFSLLCQHYFHNIHDSTFGREKKEN